MGTSEKLCLQWNDFRENITSSFRELREDTEFTDVTLVCEDGNKIEAHKVVLVSSSPLFKKLLKMNKHPHPLIYMRGLRSEDLAAIIDFLYYGETNVFQENLDSFLALAEELRLKGLTAGAEGEKEPMNKTDQMERVSLKKENNQQLLEPMPRANFESPPSKGPFNATVARTNDKINVELQDLDEQIKSMITKSDAFCKNGRGKMSSCNICGKEGPYKDMSRHVEANHITGISHNCDMCGKVFRSRNSLRVHIASFHNRRHVKTKFLQDET